MSSTAAPRRLFLGLGSNLGNRLANLQDALRRAEPALRLTAVSALYESDPVGPPGQPPYYNAVAAAVTSLEPTELLAALKGVEWALGRRPGPRWGARPIDLDILAIEGDTLDTPALTLPHPRIGERPFVLVPFAELDPTWPLDASRTLTQAVDEANRSGLRRIAGPDWLTALSVGPPGVRPDPATL